MPKVSGPPSNGAAYRPSRESKEDGRCAARATAQCSASPACIFQDFWAYALAGSFVVFFILRTLKKTTKVLDVAGREYV